MSAQKIVHNTVDNNLIVNIPNEHIEYLMYIFCTAGGPVVGKIVLEDANYWTRQGRRKTRFLVKPT
jgi:hypothetical protein